MGSRISGAKDVREKLFLRKKQLIYRIVTAVKDGVGKPAQVLENTLGLIVSCLGEQLCVTY
jgi:hypothetical protein